MKLLKVLYYYYYKFYTVIIPDDQPHATVIFTLSLTESFWFNSLIDMIAVNWFCYKISKWIMIGVALFLMIINYIYYHKKYSAKEILNDKPQVFKSNSISIMFTVLFALIGVSWLFWGSIYTRAILENCP